MVVGSGVRWTRTKSRLRDGFGRRLGHGYTENLGHVPVFDILRLTLSIRPYSMAHTPEEKVSIVFPGTVNQSTTDTHKVSDMNGSCLSPCPNPDLETSDTNKIKNSDIVVNCSIDINSLRLLLFALFEPLNPYP